MFLGVGLAGFAVAGGFLAYPAGFAKPLILFIEAFMTLSIAVTLPMLVAGPPHRRAAGDDRRDAAGLSARRWSASACTA